MTVTLLQGDCRQVLLTLPSESVHCVVCSPPYWGLRDYGVAGQIGMEPSYGDFIKTMVAVFRDVRRVLRADGTLWLNLGDSYHNSDKGGYAKDRVKATDSLQASNLANNFIGAPNRQPQQGLKPKDLCGIPWRVAFALQADGWWLRQDIIWSKPNPMPESVTDRCTKAHEYLFLLSKSERYYYDADAIREAAGDDQGPGVVGWATGKDHTAAGHNTGDRSDSHGARNTRKSRASGNKTHKGVTEYESSESEEHRTKAGLLKISDTAYAKRNKRSVWEIATAPYSEAHFATFPPALIEPCVLAGCPQECCAKCGAPWVRIVQKSGGTTGKSWHNHSNDAAAGMSQSIDVRAASAGYKVETLGFSSSCSCNAGTAPGFCLDPFGGAGTTGLVADRLGRNAILIELNPEYAAMAERRIRDDAGMFAKVDATALRAAE